MMKNILLILLVIIAIIMLVLGIRAGVLPPVFSGIGFIVISVLLFRNE